MKTSVAVFAFLAFTVCAHAQDLTSVDFFLRDIEGTDQSFQKYLKSVRVSDDQPKKGVIILSFWALWCKPCQQEMKSLRETFEKYKDRNVHYLAINTDNVRSIAKVKAWVAAEKLPYNFWLDPDSEVFKKLNGQSMPYSLMLSESGKLLAKRTGFLAGDEKDIEKDILKYLE